MTLSGNINDDDFKDILPDQTCRRYTLAEIQSATDNFDESLVIGRGGFGQVYKCSSKILSVMEVAIKRLTSMSKQGACEFEAEVKVLSKLRHGNLVSLIGYCNEEKEMILVYEFMPNGTLENHLHKAADTNFRWLRRLKICIGAARGLDYLHTGPSTQHGVIHRDVKTSNILLDANFNAKISDFGLAKVSPINQTITFVNTQVKGTFGYMDPSYFFSGKLTRKSDVYAFGVVLFEVLSGRQAVDPTLDEGLAAWAQTRIKEGKINQIIDPRLIGQISKKCLKEFSSIAGRCLHNEPKRRPTMAEITLKLESILLKEKERDDSFIYEGRFISIVRNFFTSRTDIMPGHEEANKSETSLFTSKTEMMPGYEEARNSGTSGFRSFTFDETRKRIYDPTKTGVGLEVQIRKRHIGKSKLDLKPEEFNHPNLVKLLQYHLKKGELSCVYELAPDPSLDQLLFEGTTSLSWMARLKIAVGAARGLSFLHQRRHPAYSQFKTTCILVDKDYNARLWDYEVDDSVVTLGSYSFQMDAAYAAPEWFRFQADLKLEGLSLHPNQDGFGVMSEVYAFGVVLLEILTGMNVLDYDRPDGKQNLVKWATPLLVDEVNLGMIIDPKLLDNSHPPKGAFKFALLVANCLQQTQDKRPSMYKISEILSQCF